MVYDAYAVVDMYGMLLIDARHKLDAAERELAELKMQVRMLQSRINYGKDVMPNMTGVTKTK